MEVENIERKYCVYMHISPSNKAYIGITCQKPNERWGLNGSEYCRGTQRRFQKAIEKYGWNNFEHIIWADGLTEEEANHMEILLIALFRTNCRRYQDPEYGYNMTDGGGGMSGHQDSEETKVKKSIASKNMWQVDGFREKMIKIHTGRKHQPCSQEVKDKISESLKGKLAKERNPMCREVYSPELNVVLYSATEAFDRYGISPQGVSNCCNGRQQTAGFHPVTGEPLHWEYVDKSYIEANKNNYSHKTGVDWWNIRPVNQYSLDGILIKRWDYILCAGIECKIDPSSIRKCCAGIYNHAGGFLWRYKDEYDEDYLYFEMPKRKTNGPIVQLDANDMIVAEYSDVPELFASTGFDKSSIYKCLNGKMKSYHGYIFKLKEDYENEVTKGVLING